MYKHDLTSKAWCDEIFEGRNKAYGAYVLRRTTARRYRIAMGLVLGIMLSLGLTAAILTHIVSNRLREATKEIEAFAKMKSWEAEQDKTLRTIAAGRRVPQAPKQADTEPTVPEVAEEVVAVEYSGTGAKGLPADAVTTEPEAPNDSVYNADREDLPEQGLLVTPTQVVEEMPQYPGGLEALVRFFDEQIEYPATMIRRKVQGEMEVAFYVDKEGNVREPHVLKSINRALDRAAIEACQKMPQWTPGRTNGKVSIVRVVVPIKFCLK